MEVVRDRARQHVDDAAGGAAELGTVPAVETRNSSIQSVKKAMSWFRGRSCGWDRRRGFFLLKRVAPRWRDQGIPSGWTVATGGRS